MPRLTFLPDGVTVEVPAGTSVLHAALEHGIFLEHACGGFCACTTCHVVVQAGFEGFPGADDDELDRLDFAEHVTPTSRLACQARVMADATVAIPQATTYGGVHESREERAARGHSHGFQNPDAPVARPSSA